MKYIVLIPARYESSRFPGKPLAKIGGEEMILRVCRQVAKTDVESAVATDDERIYKCVTDAGFKAIMTSDKHRSGTERVEEAYRLAGIDADVIINVQGDEPFIRPEQILKVVELFEKYPDAKIGTLTKRFESERGFEALSDPNLVKLVFDNNMNALYFSRSVIPFVRKKPASEWLSDNDFHTHIGIYGYRASILSEIVHLPESTLEITESLEQLRWLQNGIPIKVGITDFSTIGIDTEQDLEEAEKFLASREKNIKN